MNIQCVLCGQVNGNCQMCKPIKGFSESTIDWKARALEMQKALEPFVANWFQSDNNDWDDENAEFRKYSVIVKVADMIRARKALG